MCPRLTPPIFLVLFVLGTVALVGLAPPTPAPAEPAPGKPAAVPAERVVYLASGLADEDLLALTAGVAGGGRGGEILIDTPGSVPHTRQFLAAYRPERVIPVGPLPAGLVELERRLGVRMAPALGAKQDAPPELGRALLPRAETVVVCPKEPRRLLLQAACLAGAVQAPLVVVRKGTDEAAELRRRLADWRPRHMLAVGGTGRLCRETPGADITELTDEEAVTALYLRHQLKKGPIEALVVANPADRAKGKGGTSVLAPWVALQRRAALLLTNEAGDNTAAVVRAALRDPNLRRADALILVASPLAIPMERRPNPAPGKDEAIEMEPLTPDGAEPVTFATGRLFHEDLNVAALVLAREHLLKESGSARKALLASNPGGGLPLLELFSRYTAKELHNRGYETTALFEKEMSKEAVRRLLPEQDVFLWEGHYKTLVEEYGLPGWTEPLRPSLVFLQSCLALNEAEAQPLLQRGAVAVVGSSSRTYSASGGAFTLAFFDALLYDDQSLGGSLRQAKNFLLAYALLKEKRLGENARLAGANRRSAWAFTLWGDPTLHLPRPATPPKALAPVRHEVKDDHIVLSVPGEKYGRIVTARYQAQTWPNARLAGLVTPGEGEDPRQLVPFLFVEVHFPKAEPGKVPRLHSRVPEKQWVFCWDSRRSCGYLLVVPTAREATEWRFRVSWEE